MISKTISLGEEVQTRILKTCVGWMDPEREFAGDLDSSLSLDSSELFCSLFHMYIYIYICVYI